MGVVSGCIVERKKVGSFEGERVFWGGGVSFWGALSREGKLGVLRDLIERGGRELSVWNRVVLAKSFCFILFLKSVAVRFVESFYHSGFWWGVRDCSQ
jgi:hypothetical protein